MTHASLQWRLVVDAPEVAVRGKAIHDVVRVQRNAKEEGAMVCACVWYGAMRGAVLCYCVAWCGEWCSVISCGRSVEKERAKETDTIMLSRFPFLRFESRVVMALPCRRTEGETPTIHSLFLMWRNDD